MRNRKNRVRLVAFLSVAMTMLGISQANALASDLKLNSRLIWGTDGEKPEDPKLKEVDGKLADMFRKHLKWKNYWEVDRQMIVAPSEKAKKYPLSPKCDVEVQHFENGMVEVKFYGEGKLRKKLKQVIPVGETLVIAGDDKNETAWFVVLDREEKAQKQTEKVADKPAKTEPPAAAKTEPPPVAAPKVEAAPQKPEIK